MLGNGCQGQHAHPLDFFLQLIDVQREAHDVIGELAIERIDFGIKLPGHILVLVEKFNQGSQVMGKFKLLWRRTAVSLLLVAQQAALVGAQACHFFAIQWSTAPVRALQPIAARPEFWPPAVHSIAPLKHLTCSPRREWFGRWSGWWVVPAVCFLPARP